MSLTNQFSSLGFSPEEAEIYLTLLQIGSGPASSIARKVGLKRLTTHNSLEHLKQKGIVSSHIQTNITRYSPIPFAELQQKFIIEREQKQQLLSQLGEGIESFIQMNHIYSHQPEATLYSWLEGIKTLYEQTLLDTTSVYAIIGTDTAKDERFLQYLYDSYIPRRNTLIHDIKTIFSKTAYQRYQANYHKRGRTRQDDRARCVDETLLPIKGGIILYGWKDVAVTSYNLHGISALHYSNQAFYESMRAIFLYLWKRNDLFLPWKLSKKS